MIEKRQVRSHNCLTVPSRSSQAKRKTLSYFDTSYLPNMLSKNSKMTLKWVFKQRDLHGIKEWAKFICTGGGCDDEGSGLFRKKKTEGARTFLLKKNPEGASVFKAV